MRNQRSFRLEFKHLLVNSGVVMLSAEKGRMVVPSEQVLEIDTPHEVKVAMPRQGYCSKAPSGEINILGNRGEAGKLDDEVLSFIAGKRTEPAKVGQK